MTLKRLLALIVLVFVVAVVVARMRGGNTSDAGGTTYAVSGVVTAAPAEGRVMVAHDEIPGYMAAMTMPFAVDPTRPPAVRPGDRVRFTLRVAEASALAEDFEVTGYDPAVVAALQGGSPATASRVRTGDAVPDFTLTDQAGRSFTRGDLDGQVTAVTFIFTRCPVPEFCPLMSKRFQEVQRETGTDAALRDVRLLSITLDPEFDTPPVLDAYARSLAADPARWRFVTGGADEIGRLTKAFAIHTEKNGVVLDHTLATAVIGRDGRVVEIWRGNQWSAREVVEALRSASAAPAGTPGAGR